MADRIMQRLAALPVLPEARAALAWLVEHDWHGEEIAQERERSQATLEAVYRALGGDPKDLEPFLLAWLTLRATLARLDHLQDNELTNPAPLPVTALIGDPTLPWPHQLTDVGFAATPERRRSACIS